MKPLELSLPIAHAPNTSLYLHLTIKSSETAPILLFLSTSSGSSTPLGSFVYALPSRSSKNEPLSTPLYVSESSLEFSTRLAKILVRQTGRPVYVGSSVGFDGIDGVDGTVEEGAKVLKDVVEVVLDKIPEAE